MIDPNDYYQIEAPEVFNCDSDVDLVLPDIMGGFLFYKKKKKMMNKYKYCWLCGSEEDITKHHLNRNLGRGTIPLCRKCHNDIEDLNKMIKSMKRGQPNKKLKALFGEKDE